MRPDQVGDRVVHRLPMLMRRERVRARARARSPASPSRARDRRRATIFTGRGVRAPPCAISKPARNSASVSIGLSVADSPIRVGRARATGAHHALEPLERERQMRAALVRRERVQFIDDHVPHRRELGAKARRGQQQEQRLGRRDENMRRPLSIAPRSSAGVSPVRRPARITPPDRFPRAAPICADTRERLIEVEPNIVGERLERRYVKHRDRVGQRAAFGLAHQAGRSPT